MNCCELRLWVWFEELGDGPSSDPKGGVGFDPLVQVDEFRGPTKNDWELLALRNCCC